jgi:hypothetical protein
MLTIIGVGVAVLAVVFLVGGGLVLGSLGREVAEGTPRAAVMSLASIARDLGDAFSVLLLALIAACFLIPGEQMRRGTMGRNPTAPDTRLPKATNVSRFRLLGTGWHGVWLLVGVVVSVVLAGFPAVASISGGWPTNIDPQFDFTNAWRTVALASFAVTGAMGGSLFKKVHYAHLVARRGDEVQAGTPRAAVWAAVTSRWRLDIWVAAVGGFIIGFAGVVPSLVDWGGHPGYCRRAGVCGGFGVVG